MAKNYKLKKLFYLGSVFIYSCLGFINPNSKLNIPIGRRADEIKKSININFEKTDTTGAVDQKSYSTSSSVKWTTNGLNVVTPDFFSFNHNSGEITGGGRTELIKNVSYITISFQFIDCPFSVNSPFETYIEVQGLYSGKTVYTYSISDMPLGFLTIDDGNIEVKYDNQEKVIALTYKINKSDQFRLDNLKFKTNKENSLVNACMYTGSYTGIKFYQREITAYQIETPSDRRLLTKNVDSTHFEVSPVSLVEPLKLFSKVYYYDMETNTMYRPITTNSEMSSFTRQIKNFIINKTYELNIKFYVNNQYLNKKILYTSIDQKAPSIKVNNLIDENKFRYSYSSALTKEDLLRLLSSNIEVYDNEQKKYFTPNITIQNYVPFVIGSYPVTIEGSDGENISYWNGYVELIDDIGPKISGPKVISTTTSNPLSSKEILDLYSFYDEIDKTNIDYSISEDNYHVSRNSLTKGDYKIQISAKDKSDNVSTQEVTVSVLDSNDAFWYISNSTLFVNENTKISAKELVRRMVDEGILENLDYKSASYIGDLSIDGTQKPGIYYVTLRVETEDGTFKYLNLNINVQNLNHETNNQIPVDEEIKEEENSSSQNTIFNSENESKDTSTSNSSNITDANEKSNKNTNSFIGFIKTIWNNIVNFFQNIFKKK